MNEIDVFGIADEWCENHFKEHKWKIKSYKVKGDTAFVDVSVLLNPSVKEISIDLKNNIITNENL